MLWSSPVMESLFRNLDFSILQQKVTANNLANLNTPDYKKFYLSLKERRNKTGDGVALNNTNPKHFSSVADDSKPRVLKDSKTLCRVDGSNVDIDQEMLEMVTNQLRYNTLAQQVGERYAQWRYVINEGRR